MLVTYDGTYLAMSCKAWWHWSKFLGRSGYSKKWVIPSQVMPLEAKKSEKQNRRLSLSSSSSESDTTTPPSQMVTRSERRRPFFFFSICQKRCQETHRIWVLACKFHFRHIFRLEGRTGSEVGDDHLEARTQEDSLRRDQVAEEGHVLLYHGLAAAHPWKPLKDKTREKMSMKLTRQ